MINYLLDLFKNIYHLFSQAIHSSFNILVTLVTVKLMSIEEFGDFSYILGFVPLCLIPSYAFSFYPITTNKLKHSSSSTLYLGLCSTILISFLVCSFLYFHNSSLIIPLFFSSLTSFFYERKRKIILNIENLKLTFVYHLSRPIFFFTILIFWFENLSAFNVLIFYSLANIIPYFIIKLNEIENDYTFEYYGLGLPILISNFFDNLGAFMSLYLSSIWLSNYDLASLNAPKVVIGFFTILTLSLENRLGFYLSSKTKLVFKDVIGRSAVFITLGAFFMTLLIFFSNFFTSNIFGKEYNDKILIIYTLCGFLMLISRPFLIIIRSTKMTIKLSKFSVILVIVNIILIFFVRDRFGLLIYSSIPLILILFQTLFIISLSKSYFSNVK